MWQTIKPKPLLEALFDGPPGSAQLSASGKTASANVAEAARPVRCDPRHPRSMSHDENAGSGFSHSLWLRNRQITVFCEGVPGTHTSHREGHAMLGRITDAIFERKPSSVKQALGAF